MSHDHALRISTQLDATVRSRHATSSRQSNRRKRDEHLHRALPSSRRRRLTRRGVDTVAVEVCRLARALVRPVAFSSLVSRAAASKRAPASERSHLHDSCAADATSLDRALVVVAEGAGARRVSAMKARRQSIGDCRRLSARARVFMRRDSVMIGGVSRVASTTCRCCR